MSLLLLLVLDERDQIRHSLVTARAQVKVFPSINRLDPCTHARQCLSQLIQKLALYKHGSVIIKCTVAVHVVQAVERLDHYRHLLSLPHYLQKQTAQLLYSRQSPSGPFFHSSLC